MISGKVEVDGAEMIGKRLDRTRVLTANYSAMWPAVGKLFAARQRKLFRGGGRPKWAPLDPDYIMQRRAQGLSGRILVRTGRLRDEVSSPTPAKSSDRFAVFGPAGRTAPHWTLHKHGTKRMPKRDPLPSLTKGERSKIREMLADYVSSAWESKASSTSSDPLITGLQAALAAARERGAIT